MWRADRYDKYGGRTGEKFPIVHRTPQPSTPEATDMSNNTGLENTPQAEVSNTGVLNFDKSVPHADVTWNFKGNFSTPSFQIVSAFSVHFPVLGPSVSANITGDLRTTGIGVTYTVSSNTQGSATFGIKDGVLSAILVATTNGITYPPLRVDLGRI
ncbi:hypothetical protein BJV74DRAFT_866313 [Russula compacta]|nr:hypothetical protein BJV74DRAFT_866313 [Russula compacta]